MIIACSAIAAERYGGRMRVIAPGAELAEPVHGGWPERAQGAEVAYFSVARQALACGAGA